MLPTKSFKRRQFVYTEGELANEMYIIKSGEVKIVSNIKKNPIEIATLGKGGFFGEVALLRDERHGATAVAESDIELLIINEEMLDKNLKQLPSWLETIIRSMADRLNDSVQKLSNATLAVTVDKAPDDESAEESEPDKEASKE